jgi:hypothetical protein
MGQLTQEQKDLIKQGVTNQVRVMAGGVGGKAATGLGSIAKSFAGTLKRNAGKVLGGTALAAGGGAAVNYAYNKHSNPIGDKFANDVYQKTSSSQNNTQYSYPIGPEKPLSINDAAGGSASDADRAEKNRQAKIRESIGAGWEDADDFVKSTKSALDNSQKYISNLGKVKGQYLASVKGYLDRTKEAIAGNRKLIERNQKEELDDLAGDTRKSINNTNIMLGIKGATGGSAAKAAARAIQQSAGRERARILRMHGDEMSYQNQAEQNALDEYYTRIKQADEWEKTMREQALLEFQTDMKNLERLKSKKSKWKSEDVKAESERNLQKFLTSLSEIQARAKTFRDNLAARISEFGGNVDALDSAAISVDAPAELQTPDFSENIDLNAEENAEDFFDPNAKGKRVIIGEDAFGNPIYEDELIGAVA